MFFRQPSVLRRCVGAAVAALAGWSALLFAQAPATSASPFQLPPELMQRDLQLAELAAEAARRGPVTPIPLYNGSRIVGVVYDQYFMGVAIGRAQLAAGQTPDAKSIVAHPNWQSRGTLVVAYPIDCNGRPNEPLAIRWKTSMNLPVSPEPIAGPMKGSAAQTILPGISVPEAALVVNLRNALLVGNASVEVDYSGPACQGTAKTTFLPIATQTSAAFIGVATYMKLPAEFASLSPATVRVQAVLDPTGRVRFPEQVQGPAELRPLVLAQLNSLSVTPWMMNGVAVPMNLMRAFVLTTTGDPAPPAPFVPGRLGTVASGVAPPGSRNVTVDSVMVTGASRPPAAPTTPVSPPPPGQVEMSLLRLAIEAATKSDPVLIPLDTAGGPVHGVVLDRYLLAAVGARAAVKAGTPIDVTAVTPELLKNMTFVVAYPVTCNGRTIRPRQIEMSAGGTIQGPVRSIGPLVDGDTLGGATPGLTLADGAVGMPFQSIAFSQNLEVRVTYAEPPCVTTGSVLTFPLQYAQTQVQPRLTTARLPSNTSLPSPTPVRLRGIVDLEGSYRFPTLADGPAELAATSVVTAAQWKFNPARVNGVAAPAVIIMPLTFTASGMPEAVAAAPPSNPAPPGVPPPSAGGPPILTSSTVGGRSTTDFTTEVAAGLTVATSKCQIATDATYGFSADAPVKIGGDFVQGPARQRQYLSALRGPNGEGLHVVRRGSTMAPDKQTILDLYEVTYPGLASPLRLYLDQYHEESALKAPNGFTCAAPIAR